MEERKNSLQECKGRISQKTIDEHFVKSVQAQDELIETWVVMGANVDANYGQELAMATQALDLKRMELLLEHGANPRNLMDYNIKIALRAGSMEAVELLYRYISKDMKATEIPKEVEEKVAYKDNGLKKWYEPIISETLEVAIETNDLKLAEFVLAREKIEGTIEGTKAVYSAISTKNIKMLKLVWPRWLEYKNNREPSFLNDNEDAWYMERALQTNAIAMIRYCMNTLYGGSLPENTFNGDLEASIIVSLNAKTLNFLMKFKYTKLGFKREEEWEEQLSYAFRHALLTGNASILELLYTDERFSDIIPADLDLNNMKRKNFYELCEWLLLHGGLKQIKNFGEKCKQIAIFEDWVEVLELLEKYNVKCNKSDFRRAIELKHNATIAYILKKQEIVINNEKIQRWLKELYYIDSEKIKIINMLYTNSSNES